MTKIRIDLQVEGMGARGHRYLFTTDEGKGWEDVEKVASALCRVYEKPVEVTMSVYDVHRDLGEYSTVMTEQRLLGRFVPYGFAPRGAIWIDADVYTEVS